MQLLPVRKYLLLVFIAVSMHLLAAYTLDCSYDKATRVNQYSEAAVAIRDQVPGWQKKATRFFSLPLLRRRYENVYYLEERDTALQRLQFIEAVQQAAALSDSVDIFLLAHSNSMYSWMNRVDAGAIKKIRLVYNCGCSDYYQGFYWRQLGVKYYAGHKGAYSLSPVFYFFFLKRWIKGQPLELCINKANRQVRWLLRLAGQTKQKADESCAALYPF